MKLHAWAHAACDVMCEAAAVALQSGSSSLAVHAPEAQCPLVNTHTQASLHSALVPATPRRDDDTWHGHSGLAAQTTRGPALEDCRPKSAVVRKL